MRAHFALKIRCFHGYDLLIFAFYLPLVVVIVVGIGDWITCTNFKGLLKLA